MRERSRALEKIKKKVAYFRSKWASWFTILIGLSIIALFACSLIFKENIELQTMNNWVGIILGMVATIASIISLILSFYNLEKEQEETRENYDLLKQLKTVSDDLKSSLGRIETTLQSQAKDTEIIKQGLGYITPTHIGEQSERENEKTDFRDLLNFLNRNGKDL